jgi:hypothetical protein
MIGGDPKAWDCRTCHHQLGDLLLGRELVNQRLHPLFEWQASLPEIIDSGSGVKTGKRKQGN